MNLQALMKQAQSMQKNMLASKEQIEKEIFEGVSELVTIKMNGKREVLSVEINKEEKLDSEDIEVLEDMILLATNDVLKKIDKEINEKMGSQAGALGGLL